MVRDRAKTKIGRRVRDAVTIGRLARFDFTSLDQAGPDIVVFSADTDRLWPCVRCHDPRLIGLYDMDWADYLRDQAAKYRQLAEQTDDPVIKNEMLELASVCEEVANNIEDHLTGG